VPIADETVVVTVAKFVECAVPFVIVSVSVVEGVTVSVCLTVEWTTLVLVVAYTGCLT
jgi:hypothetical protein